ncbi:MAG TPA: Ig-like domain-containing protein, partial [Polyangiaceae bacterium]|nr:Ig-like domain-containing protein [Polyangiaceae bacterium]
MHTKRAGLALLIGALGIGLTLGACSGEDGGVAGPSGLGGGGGSAGASGSGGSGAGVVIDGGGDAALGLSITPPNPTLVYDTSKPAPTVQFQVVSAAGTANALWAVDRAEIGSISATGLFTAAGTAAGAATVEATVGTVKLTTKVNVEILAVQNGGTPTTGNIKAGGGPG